MKYSLHDYERYAKEDGMTLSKGLLLCLLIMLFATAGVYFAHQYNLFIFT